jgi:hypothetical protein
MTAYKQTMTPEEEAEWAEKVQTGGLFAEESVLTHGRYSTYNFHGCRCAECRAANAAHGRAMYAKRRATGWRRPV